MNPPHRPILAAVAVTAEAEETVVAEVAAIDAKSRKMLSCKIF
jgi:hypothetical protein